MHLARKQRRHARGVLRNDLEDHPLDIRLADRRDAGRAAIIIVEPRHDDAVAAPPFRELERARAVDLRGQRVASLGLDEFFADDFLHRQHARKHRPRRAELELDGRLVNDDGVLERTEQILARAGLAAHCVRLGQAVEGVQTAREVLLLARQCGVEMPIAEQVYRVLYQGCSPRDAVSALFERAQKTE